MKPREISDFTVPVLGNYKLCKFWVCNSTTLYGNAARFIHLFLLWSAVGRVLKLEIEGYLVRVTPPAEPLCCVLEKDTLSAA